MKGADAVKLLRAIENEYDVMSIKLKEISVWPYLRVYLKDSISTKRELKASSSIVGLVLKCLFTYNPFRVLQKHDIWVFTSCDERKKMGDKMVSRVSGAFAKECKNSLMIEKPLKGIGHYPQNIIDEQNIISETWLLLVSHILELLLRVKKIELQNEDLLKQILAENSVKYNYLRYVRRLVAQRMAMRLMLKLSSNPQKVFIECPYTCMGYLWAFHEENIKVIEMQHGSLNGKHLAYSAKNYEPMINPDSICVFGEREYKYLTEEKPQYANRVVITGLYIIELADKYFIKDIFIEERNKYQAVIVVSGQPTWEIPLSLFVDAIAENHKKVLFVYIPRNRQENLKFKSGNVRLVKGVNIYEYLKWADIHITITSTTCLEAQYFKTPTIFYNYENISSNYFKDYLFEENGFAFVDNPQQFDDAYNKIFGHNFEYVEFFARDHVRRLMEVLNENI